MENVDKGEIFHTCARAVLTVALNEPLTSTHEEIFLKGREALMEFIHELSETPRGKESATKAMIRRAMTLVHSRTDYSFSDALIRDLADVCVTLRKLAERGHRSDYDKNMHAKILFDALADELTPE